MFPIKDCDSVSCLESLVALRSSCKTADCAPMYVESAGFDKKKLTKLATASAPSVDEFVKDIIHFSAQEMLGDIQGFMNSGYTLKDFVADSCSACELNTIYTAGAGIIVKNQKATRFGQMKITDLTLLCNNTGSNVIVIDDGVTMENYNVTTVAGVKMPVKVNYTTNERKVSIYLQNNTVGMGKVTCTTASGCGCGKKAASSPVTITGLINGVEGTNQFGFLPCVSVTCSTDLMVCRMVQSLPNKFALVLFYKVAGKIWQYAGESGRNNNEAGFGEELKITKEEYYNRLYWANLKGSSNVKGIRVMVSDFLQKNLDGCVTCKINRSTAFATG